MPGEGKERLGEGNERLGEGKERLGGRKGGGLSITHWQWRGVPDGGGPTYKAEI